MKFEVLRLAGSLAIAGAVMLTTSAAMAGDWKKGRGHHHHEYDGEVIFVKPARPVYYAPYYAPRPVVVYPAPVYYAPPVAYAPAYGPAYPGGNLSIGVNVPLR